MNKWTTNSLISSRFLHFICGELDKWKKSIRHWVFIFILLIATFHVWNIYFRCIENTTSASIIQNNNEHRKCMLLYTDTIPFNCIESAQYQLSSQSRTVCAVARVSCYFLFHTDKMTHTHASVVLCLCIDDVAYWAAHREPLMWFYWGILWRSPMAKHDNNKIDIHYTCFCLCLYKYTFYVFDQRNFKMHWRWICTRLYSNDNNNNKRR